MKKILSLMLALLIIIAGVPMLSISAESTFEIVSATYGSVTEKIDVTDTVSGMMSNGVLPEFTVGDDTLGCTPSKSEGEINRLVVCYTQNGETKYLCIAEGSNAALPFVYDPEQSDETNALLAQDLTVSTAEKVWPEDLRGFNFGGLMGNFSGNPGHEGEYVTAETFIRLREMGVNVLRIPIAADNGYDWSLDTIPASDPVAPYRHHLEGLKVALQLAEKYDMWIIPSGDLVVGRKNGNLYEGEGKGYYTTLNALWAYIAENYGSHPRLLGYDLLNEPNSENEADYWDSTVLPIIVDTIREYDTNSYLVVEPYKFAFPSNMSNITPLQDAKAVYSFHYYFPHQYTHQGIGEYTEEFAYPGEMGNFPGEAPIMWDKAKLEATVEAVKEFQEANNAKIFIGEFGAVRRAEGNAQWIEDCISIWEDNGWGWCYHSYGGYNGFNPTFDASAIDSNIMDGGVETEALKVLKAGFELNPPAPPTVKQTTTNSTEVQNFVTENIPNNLLAGVTPIVSEEGTTYHDPGFDGGWEAVVEGNYISGEEANRKTFFPTGQGTEVFRISYSLGKRVSISDLLVVCRSNHAADFGFDYEIYVSDYLNTLYNAENCVFTKTNDVYAEGGQLISYNVGSRAKGSYVGFRITGANKNKYHIGELGVYGETVESIPVVKDTAENEADVSGFVTANKTNNLLAGLTPTAVEENADGGTYDLSVYNPYDHTTDANYSTYNAAFMTGRGIGKYRFTYTLSQRTTISDLLVVCRENKVNDYGFDYEIYVSDELNNLYSEDNLVFVKSKDNYVGGGQWISLAEDIRPTGTYVGFRITDYAGLQSDNAYRFHISEFGVYGEEADPIPVVKDTAQNDADVRNFAANNASNNLLAGLTPTAVEEKADGGTFDLDLSGSFDNIVDGDFATFAAAFMTSQGIGKYRFTYTLSQRTAISDLLVVCRENHVNNFGFDYEIYVSDELNNLYNEDKLVFVKTKDNYAGGGQWVNFAEKIRPAGTYVGFRITDYAGIQNGNEYRFHISEFGVYGSKAASLSVVKDTAENESEVSGFATTNKTNNLLAGLTPTAVEEKADGGTFDLTIWGAGFPGVTDADYGTSMTAFMTSQGIGKYRFTYTLSQRTTISDLLVVCRENKVNDYGFDYEIYVSDELNNLYSEDNLVFVKTKDKYAGGGQWISLAEDIRPTGKYVGFRITDYVGLQSDNAYRFHISEFGVYGSKAAPLPEIIDSATQGNEIKNFIASNNNLLAGITPTISEEGTSVDQFYIGGENGLSALTDGSYASSTDRATINCTENGYGILRVTYALAESSKISALAVACREDNYNSYGFDYEVYASASLEDLYTAENLMFTKTGDKYPTSAQMISFAEEIQPEAMYVGFRLTSSKQGKAYHVGEFGVYGTPAVVEERVEELQITASDSDAFEAVTVDKNLDYLFKFTASEESGYFTVQHQLTGLFLTMKNGAIVLADRDEDNYYQLWKAEDMSGLYGVQGVFDLVCYGEDGFAMTTLSGSLEFSEITGLGAVDGRSWVLGTATEVTDGLVCTLNSYYANGKGNYLSVNQTLWGDLNSDESRDILDLIVLKKMSLLSVDPIINSDLNADGILASADDLTVLRRILMEIWTVTKK